MEAYLSHSMSHTRAADSLGVHRHTKIYRLNQVSKATSLDPRETRGAIHFGFMSKGLAPFKGQSYYPGEKCGTRRK